MTPAQFWDHTTEIRRDAVRAYDELCRELIVPTESAMMKRVMRINKGSQNPDFVHRVVRCVLAIRGRS